MQPIAGQHNSVAPSVQYIVAPAPPSLVAPYCIPTRHIESFEMKCYSCGETGNTDTKYEKSALQWLFCLIIILVGGWVCCLCFIPFCMKTLRRYEHYCPHCGTSVAYKDPMH